MRSIDILCSLKNRGGGSRRMQPHEEVGGRKGKEIKPKRFGNSRNLQRDGIPQVFQRSGPPQHKDNEQPPHNNPNGALRPTAPNANFRCRLLVSQRW